MGIPCLRSDVGEGIVASRIIPGSSILEGSLLAARKGRDMFYFCPGGLRMIPYPRYMSCTIGWITYREQARLIKIINPAMRSLIKVPTSIDRLNILREHPLLYPEPRVICPEHCMSQPEQTLS